MVASTRLYWARSGAPGASMSRLLQAPWKAIPRERSGRVLRAVSSQRCQSVLHTLKSAGAAASEQSVGLSSVRPRAALRAPVAGEAPYMRVWARGHTPMGGMMLPLVALGVASQENSDAGVQRTGEGAGSTGGGGAGGTDGGGAALGLRA
eukprot:364251-Chlamydomonas_euryale.AAC.1